MRFPFVSRGRFELLQHNFEHERKALHAEEARHAEARLLYNSLLASSSADRARYDSLLEKFCSMKLAGAVIPEPAIAPVKKEQDPAVQMINALSAGRPGLRAQMMKQLTIDRADPLAEEVEIMRRIEMGVVSEEGVPA